MRNTKISSSRKTDQLQTDPDTRILGLKIKAQRRQLHVPLTTTAEMAGISRVTLHRIERGENTVSMRAYITVMRTLGLTFDVCEASVPDAKVRVNKRHSTDNEKLVAKTIPVNRYSQLKTLAWQIDPATKLTTEDALNIYERNWRHVDKSHLEPRELAFIKRIQKKHGRHNIPV